MANIKNLFNKTVSRKVLASSSLNTVGSPIESADYVIQNFEEQSRFVPHVNFASASNFAFYGSAKKYYEDAFTYIANEYPYDGSLKEKINWELSGTYFDKHVFDNVYPRRTGYINHGINYGSVVTIPGVGGFYEYSHEYIKFFGGPHTGSSNVASNLSKNFSGSNVYDADTNQESNIELDGNTGFAVEFWFKKDAWAAPATESRSQVILDISNNSTDDPGRLTIWADRSAPNNLLIEVASGSTDTYISNLGSSLPIIGSDWNHYSLNFQNVGSDLQVELYLNGELNDTKTSSAKAIQKVTGSFFGYIGALTRATEVLGQGGEGYGKLSASLDDFRFWKSKRTPEQIARNWFTQIAGGTNTDYSTIGTGSAKYSPGKPVDLGIYYKFNEGIYNSGSVDANDTIVLDYSGRLSNGNWTGYSVGSRETGSAMIESSASLSEFKDPILNLNHPSVSSSLEYYKSYGEIYDSTNNSSIFHTLPGWIREEDLENDRETLLKLSQIIGSYFDTLQLQVGNLQRIKDQEYVSGSFKPYPFTNRLVESLGFEVGELFTEADALELCASRNDFFEFSKKLDQIKNRIYSNLYNNLTGILKSKGTEKAFRNVIRCYGIDDNLVRLNLYANQVDYELKDNFDPTIIRKRYADFNAQNRLEASVYQSTSSVETNNTRSYLSASTELQFKGNTFETEVIFPQKVSRELSTWFSNNFVENSIFGAHTVDKGEPEELRWEEPDAAGFIVTSVRDKKGSKSVYFKLSSSSGYSAMPILTSSLINDVYTNSRWNLSVRVKPKAYPYASTAISGSDGESYAYDVVFAGYNMIGDSANQSFYATGTMSNTAGKQFLTGSKRMFIGAHRQNFTGSTLIKSDVKISSTRAWMDYLDDDTIKLHAKDSANFGTKSPLKNAYMSQNYAFFGKNVDKIPQIKTLALNWDFETVTGSDSTGAFTVKDASSGSQAATNDYGWLGPVSLYQHTGRGVGFPTSDTGSISREFVQSVKQLPPEVLNSTNMIDLVDSNDDSLFTRESRPMTFFFAAEKSMYRIVSDEILKVFATIVDFNNLIGEPINRYRPNYKQLDKLREIYFERVENSTIDFEKFVDYYKWLDQSISIALIQLFPASADFSNRIYNMVESHILERNKYWSKFPLVKKFPSTEGAMRGIGELSYNWKRGHAPIPNSTTGSNCLWWSDRAERGNANVTSGDSTVDSQRNTFRDANDTTPYPTNEITQSNKFPTLFQPDGTAYKGDVYGIRNFSKVVKFEAIKDVTIKGGSNFVDGKNLDFTHEQLKSNAIGTTGIKLKITASSIDKEIDCNDVIDPNAKERLQAAFVYTSAATSNLKTQLNYVGGKATNYAPFSLFSSSVTPNYLSNFRANTQITNYHDDSYGTFYEVPMQGPFTNAHVGGRQHRHINVNTGAADTPITRPEAWNLDVNTSEIQITARNSNANRPRAIYMREDYAKRPLNIRNIKWTTSSAVVGNYQKDYEILITNGRKFNNRYFVKAEGFTPSASTSTFIKEMAEFGLPRFDETGSNKFIIVNRFNAPGGPDVSARGVLDYVAEEYAVYNDLNFRNTVVRDPLNEWSRNHTAQFGILSGNSVRELDYDTSASYYKVNRNTRVLPLNNSPATRRLYDNTFVQHAIPQSAYQYRWITASVSKSSTDVDQLSLGYVTDASIPSGSTSMTQSVPFIASSDSGSGPVLVDFIGLNTLIFDPIVPNERILSSSTNVYRNDELTGGLKQGSVLNALLLHRNGPYENPSWKQIRGYENPIVRYQRKNNTLSMRENPSNSLYSFDKITRKIPPGVSGTVIGELPPFVSKTNKNTTTLWTTASLTEPPVSFKYRPILTVLKPNNVLQNHGPSYLEHSYGNNIATFANKKFVELLAIDEDLIENRQNYHQLKKLYENNESAELRRFSYEEVVYPRDVNTGLNKIRCRTNYSEEANSTGSDGINRSILDRRTFWRNNLSDRIRSSASEGERPLNAMNFQDPGAGNLWPLDSKKYEACGDSSERGDRTRFNFAGEIIRYGRINGVWAFNTLSQSIEPPMFYTASSHPDLSYQSIPTASLLYVPEVAAAPNDELPVQWRTNIISGKNPWFDSYDDYSSDIKKMAKEYTVIPEFKISDHIDYYVNIAGGDFRAKRNNLFRLDGANITSSANSSTGSLNDEFFTTYSNSDFQKYFGTFTDDSELNKITLTCNGVKKLLPYNGFYPVLRTTQMGSILSQSVAENIGGIGWKDGQPTSTASEYSGALAVQSLIQPWFAPGIIYNTIKSGIAVDWPTFTGSLSVSRSADTTKNDYGGVLTAAPNYRIPFESLVSFKDHVPVSQSNGEGKISLLNTGLAIQAGAYEREPFFDWDGTIKPTFELATNNFLAEVPNFFLKDNSFTSITSKPENEFKSFKSGSTYFMDVFLEMPRTGSSRTVMFEGYHSLGSGNGVDSGFIVTSGTSERTNFFGTADNLEYRGRWYGPLYKFTGSFGDTGEEKYAVSLDPASAPCTPPYFYGKSIATIKYVADGTETGTGILEKILTNSTIEYKNPRLNEIGQIDGNFLDQPAYTAAMMLSSSLNLLGKTRLKQVEYNLNQDKGNQFVPTSATDPTNSSFDAWVVSPKFETPVLDFSNPGICEISGNDLTRNRGMWADYGEFCTGSKGLFLGIEETFPTLPEGSGQGTTGLTGSLIKQCGFDSTNTRERVGEIADRKTISEAIVAIPYLENPVRAKKTKFARNVGSPSFGKWFFTLSGKSKKDSRKLYNQTKINVQNNKSPLSDLPFKSEKKIVETSVSELVEKLDKYVIPPELNFDLYSDIEPFAMYIMEFEHELDRQDLADIWQGVMPKISVTAEKDTSTVEHQIAPWEFFGGKKLPEGIKWMVFKVKKKAEINYFKATADSSDDDRFRFNFRNNKKAIPDYSYNWPYDFFSLVELAQIEVENEFKNVRDSDGGKADDE